MTWWRAFLRGIGRMTLWPAPYRPEFLARTDAEALASDWQAVGDDLRMATMQVMGVYGWTCGDCGEELSRDTRTADHWEACSRSLHAYRKGLA